MLYVPATNMLVNLPNFKRNEAFIFGIWQWRGRIGISQNKSWRPFLGEEFKIVKNHHLRDTPWNVPKGRIHPGRLTWNPKMEVWKMMFLFNRVILAHFQGCRLLMSSALLIIAGPRTETDHFFGSASPELLGSWTCWKSHPLWICGWRFYNCALRGRHDDFWREKLANTPR